MFAPDFPDWIEEDKVGIKLAPDQRTITIMKTVLNGLENNKAVYSFFEQLHTDTFTKPVNSVEVEPTFNNQQLNGKIVKCKQR